MSKILLLLTACLFISCKQENQITNVEQPQSKLKTAADFYPKERAQVLVVGTFHFNYPGLDALKTEESDKIDVLKEPKKSEVTELVEYIKRFKPTKIVIESKSPELWNQRFKEYKNGEHRDKRDERYQLAMRIANDFSLDTLYAVDAVPLSNVLWRMKGD